MKVGDRVRVKNQSESCAENGTGVVEYPNRVGTVVRQNQFGHDRLGGLWYVKLDATPRAKARETCMFGRYLEVI